MARGVIGCGVGLPPGPWGRAFGVAPAGPFIGGGGCPPLVGGVGAGKGRGLVDSMVTQGLACVHQAALPLVLRSSGQEMVPISRKKVVPINRKKGGAH